MTRLPERVVAGDPPRVILRLHGPEHAADIADAINESLEHLSPWMAWAHRPTTAQEQALRLALVVEQFEHGADAIWSITEPDGRIVGGCGLHHRDDPDALDIGYWLHVDATGRGYVTTVAAALSRLAIEVAGKPRVRITCDAANERSAAVPARLGFRHVRTVPEDDRQTMLWSMEAEDWPGSPGAAVPVSYG